MVTEPANSPQHKVVEVYPGDGWEINPTVWEGLYRAKVNEGPLSPGHSVRVERVVRLIDGGWGLLIKNDWGLAPEEADQPHIVGDSGE